MGAVMQQDWHGEALELRQQGLSERKIAEAVGKSPSAVHDVLAKAQADLAARAQDAAGIAGDREEAQIPGQTAIEALEEQAGPGERVTPLQDERSPAPPAPLEEVRVDGTTQLGMFDAGGKRPQSASLRLTGGKVLLVDGRAFQKGDTITGTFTAVVDEVGQKDKVDGKTGIVVSAEQKHSARITDLRVSA